MGVPTYFWPCLPLTGSQKAITAFFQFCRENFGSTLHVMTEKKIKPRAKANLIMKDLTGGKGPHISDYP